MEMKTLNSSFKVRLYQELIASTAIQKNTLVILPTGLGKTYIAILVVAYKIEKNPEGKVLMLAPTRPLVNQHMQTFKKYIIGKEEDFVSLTGKIHATSRRELYKTGKFFFATPQLIKNDVKAGILDLSSFVILIVDECHRSVKNYAYNSVVDEYFKSNPNPLVLGLTASPGGIKDKIEEVKRNLRIEAVEIRTEKDLDVQPYVKETEIEKIFVELPEEFKEIKANLEKIYNQKIYDLLRVKVIHNPKVSKKDLLMTQQDLGRMYRETRDNMVARALVACAEAIKIGHAIELIETQGTSALYQYFEKMGTEKGSQTNRKVLSDFRIKRAFELAKNLQSKNIDHPKLEKLVEIIKTKIKEKPTSKIIVFANYRDSVEKICKTLEKAGIEAREFYGQAKKRGKGLSQKEQIQLLNEFELEIFNVLVATSVAEEGISIPAVDLVVFYEPVPSEIRTIQRRGRTGRTETGKVIFLITKNTRDEWYYWSAFNKEKRMKGVLKDMKKNQDYLNGQLFEKKDQKKTIIDFLKKGET